VAEQVLEEFLNSHSGDAGPTTFDEVYDLDRWVRQRTLERLRIAA
jgi:hypothetical protein